MIIKERGIAKNQQQRVWRSWHQQRRTSIRMMINPSTLLRTRFDSMMEIDVHVHEENLQYDEKVSDTESGNNWPKDWMRTTSNLAKAPSDRCFESATLHVSAVPRKKKWASEHIWSFQLGEHELNLSARINEKVIVMTSKKPKQPIT